LKSTQPETIFIVGLKQVGTERGIRWRRVNYKFV